MTPKNWRDENYNNKERDIENDVSLQCFLLTVPRYCLLCGSFLLFNVHVCHCYAVYPVSCCLVVTCWEMTDLLALLCVMLSCVLSLSHTVSRLRCGT